MTHPHTAPRSIHRADIQGLRAIAVILVVLFHLWPNRVPGGYIGVDVFFVISGFLITSHLVRELHSTGSLNVGRFWARRAVRLLPASFTVIVVSLIAVVVLVPDSLIGQFVFEGAASSAYFVNWVLAANSVDYLAADNLASPFQHFWTLSVEEQFYIAVPIILLATALITRRTTVSTFRIVLGTAALLSFGYGIWLTATTPSVAYFSTFTRAWEFLAGGLLALVPLSISRRFSGPLSILGVAGIVASAFVLDASSAFPGWLALLPVLSTLLVIASGPVSWVGDLSRFQPVLLTGTLSYSIYLWHWPLIVLLPYATGAPLTTVNKVVIAVATVFLAWLTYTFIENPARFSVALTPLRKPRAVFAWMIALIVVIGTGAYGVTAVTTMRIEAAAKEAEAALAAGKDADCFGAAARDPATGCPANPLGTMLIPDPASTGANANRVECWTGSDSAKVNVCQLGPAEGYTRTLFAIGDSHNSALLTTYEKIAHEKNWRIDLTGHNGCYWTAREQDGPILEYREKCTEWKSSIRHWLNERPAYDGIFTMHAASRWPAVRMPGETQDEATVNGMVEAWSEQTARGTKVLAIRDNPVQRDDVKSCVDQNRADPNRCALPRAEALAWFDGSAEAVALTPGAHLIDLTPLFCTADICPVVIGNAVVYSDRDHLTAEFAETLSGYIAAAAEAAF